MKRVKREQSKTAVAAAKILPLFDDIKNIEQNPVLCEDKFREDYQKSLNFLISYRGSLGTFNSYRREIERLLQWSWWVAGKTLPSLRRYDIEQFIEFCQKPPLDWIGLRKAPRYLEKEGRRIPNPEWRPFVATLPKTSHQKGEKPKVSDFELSSGSVKESFAILSSFFNFLIQEEYVFMNPVALIRQKSKFIRKNQGMVKIRRLSDVQWQTVIDTAEGLAAKESSAA